MAHIPQDLRYTRDHEWVRTEGGRALVGITDYAQRQLGDIVFVDLPRVGGRFEAQQPFGSIEMTDPRQLGDLLDAEAYHDFCAEEEAE